MKKLLLSAALISALLAGCSEDEAKPNSDVKEPAASAPTEENTPAEETTDTPEEAVTPEQTVTPEQAEKTLSIIEENAKKDEQLKDVTVEETEEAVNVVIEFEENTTDEEKGLFLLNYQIMMNAAHPDKELKFDIKE